MRKYISYGILGLIIVGGLYYTSLLGMQPRAVNKIKLQSFENPAAIASSIILSLQLQMKAAPHLVWGLEISHPEMTETLEQFLAQNQDPSTKYDVVFVDTNIQGMVPELVKIQGERLNTQEESSRLIQGLKAAQAQNLRVLVITPVTFAASYLQHSVARKIKEAGLPLATLLLTSLPRSREQESQTRIPCNVNVRDNDGTGKLGCDIVQTARLQYRQKFQAGQLVGMMNQISEEDSLFLLAHEP
jgi:hypothetical protein